MSNVKQCRDCREVKPAGEFGKNCQKPDGLEIYCKPCRKVHGRRDYLKHKDKRLASAKVWAQSNRDKTREYTRKWQKANPEKLAAAYASHYRRNRERLLEQDRQRRLANIDEFRDRERERERRDRVKRKLKSARWREANPGKIRAQAAKRRNALSQRLPRWTTEDDLRRIDEMYRLAADMTEMLGEVYHVDHELPLRGKFISGLHVPSNLQILPARMNLQKSNQWKPE